MSTTTLSRSVPRRRAALRISVVALAASLGLGLAAVSAQADDPRPTSGEGTVTITSPLTTTAGATVTLQGSGFAADPTAETPTYQVLSVKIDDVNPVVATFQLAPDGTFAGTVTLPADLATGKHWFRVLGSAPIVSQISQKFTTVAVLLVTPGVPAITGTASTDSVVTAQPGAWTAGAALAYQWNRNGSPVAGATGQAYRVVAADVARTLTVTVTGSLAGHTPSTQTSAGVVVRKGTLAKATPRLTGKAKVGRTLKVSRGTWTSGASFTYKWYANGKPVKGAKKSSLKLAAAQKGKRITVKVTGRKSGYTTVAKTSKKTSKVAKR